MEKNMEKVSIITRAYNRLEYTIKCIDGLIKNTQFEIVQLKVNGIGSKININNLKKIKYHNDELILGSINRPVACFMLKTKKFKTLIPKLKNTGLLNSNDGKSNLSKELGGTGIIKNVICQHIDGYNGKEYLNYEKYPKKLIHFMK